MERSQVITAVALATEASFKNVESVIDNFHKIATRMKKENGHKAQPGETAEKIGDMAGIMRQEVRKILTKYFELILLSKQYKKYLKEKRRS